MATNRFLVETALLTHGMDSISNESLLGAWPFNDGNIAWLEAGEIIIGNIHEFVSFRQRAADVLRIDGAGLKKACADGKSGALTASGTMMVAKDYNIEVVVTAGMGGIGNIDGEKFCYDLTALKELPITLISTGPKDVVDAKATFQWLRDNQVVVNGYETAVYNGFVFTQPDLPIEMFQDWNQKPKLLLNPIAVEKRFKDKAIFDEGLKVAKAKQKEGYYFYPALNTALDALTKSRSTWLQLEALIENIKVAENLLK